LHIICVGAARLLTCALVMNIKLYIYSLCVCLSLASCKSLKQISSRDDSNNKSSTSRDKNRDPRFLDDINVTPGGVANNTTTSSSKRSEKERKTTVSKVEPDPSLSNSNIENANWLQLKYSIIFDASVEKLNNPALLQNIDKWWGTKYCLGGSTENCLDCSAFTQIMLRDVYNVTLPRTAQEQYNLTERVDQENLQEGDLVFFHTSGRRSITHVGIYILNNKFVHAATSGGVMVSDLNDNYWRAKYKGGGRPK
jgi:cell wall-associated NlpC family hydrolase